MHKSMQSADYESPPNRQTKKKQAADERYFEDTHPVEARSEVEEDPEIFRLES